MGFMLLLWSHPSQLGPIMKSGLIDIFSLIGTTNAAKEVLAAHPHPHRLRVCLGLEAKNPAFILQDANLSTTVAEIKAGESR